MARLKDNLGRPAKEVDFPLEDLTLNILIMPTTMRTNSQAVQTGPTTTPSLTHVNM